VAKKKRTTYRSEELPSFEASLDELEAIVAELEGGKLRLSDALTRYEQGVKHLKACQKWLQQAERKIELLSGVMPRATRLPSRSTTNNSIRWKKKRPLAGGGGPAARGIPRPNASLEAAT